MFRVFFEVITLTIGLVSFTIICTFTRYLLFKEKLNLLLQKFFYNIENSWFVKNHITNFIQNNVVFII